MIGFPRPGGPQAGWQRARIGPAFGRHGMVGGAHPLVVETGLAMLRAGGNAVDAAVAAAMTAAVVIPESCGIGGELFAIVHAPGEAPVAILGGGAAPRTATLEQMRTAGPQTPTGPRMPLTGPLSVATPGMVHACGALLDRYGTRSISAASAYAIDYAEAGFPISTVGAMMIASSSDLLRRYPSTAAVMLPGGQPPTLGQLFRQPDLARTLKAIAADGPTAFYRGDIARSMATAVQALGGALSVADLDSHTTVVEPTISTTYRGYSIHQTGLPSSGLILLEALNLVENASSAALAPIDAAAIHTLVEATKLAFVDRLSYARDPAFGPTPLATLISKSWASNRFAAIDPEHAAEMPPPGSMSTGDTTYLCVVDEAGMMVSLIQSISSQFGSGIIAGDTGVLLNNRAGRGFTLDDDDPNVFAPGKKTMNTLNCWSACNAEGVPVMVGGTPGGDRQPQWNLQMLCGLIDSGLDVQTAVELPRWQIFPGADPADRPNPYSLIMETRFGAGVAADLKRRGHRVTPVGPWGGGGVAQIIARDPATGVLVGGSDPRGEGLVLGF